MVIEELTTKKITDAACAGDALALATLFEVGTYLGRGIANLIETFNPEKVVLSGGASAAFDFLLPGIKVTLRKHCCFSVTRERAIIERSTIADDVGLLGPAAVFLEKRGVLRKRALRCEEKISARGRAGSPSVIGRDGPSSGGLFALLDYD